MKKCSFCTEEIQDDAIKCRFCGEWLNKPSQDGPAQQTEPTKTAGSIWTKEQKALAVAGAALILLNIVFVGILQQMAEPRHANYHPTTILGDGLGHSALYFGISALLSAYYKWVGKRPFPYAFFLIFGTITNFAMAFRGGMR